MRVSISRSSSHQEWSQPSMCQAHLSLMMNKQMPFFVSLNVTCFFLLGFSNFHEHGIKVSEKNDMLLQSDSRRASRILRCWLRPYPPILLHCYCLTNSVHVLSKRAGPICERIIQNLAWAILFQHTRTVYRNESMMQVFQWKERQHTTLIWLTW